MNDDPVVCGPPATICNAFGVKMRKGLTGIIHKGKVFNAICEVFWVRGLGKEFQLADANTDRDL